MTNLSKEELLTIAHEYYPVGFPPEMDDYSEPTPAYQRTTESRRWAAAWERAMAWEKWNALLADARAAFPDHQVGDVTQPWMSACRRCCVYLVEPLAGGGEFVTRVAGAASVLAPLYLVYVTTQTIWSRTKATRPQLTFEPAGTAKLYAGMLEQLIAGRLGYQPFPLEFANVPLPNIRVDFLKLKQPTLLTALLSDDLENLP